MCFMHRHVSGSSYLSHVLPCTPSLFHVHLSSQASPYMSTYVTFHGVLIMRSWSPVSHVDTRVSHVDACVPQMSHHDFADRHSKIHLPPWTCHAIVHATLHATLWERGMSWRPHAHLCAYHTPLCIPHTLLAPSLFPTCHQYSSYPACQRDITNET